MSDTSGVAASHSHNPNSAQQVIYRQFARGYNEQAPKHEGIWEGDKRICAQCRVRLTNKNSYRNCKGEPK